MLEMELNFDISPETHIYSIFVDPIVPIAAFANGGLDAQRSITMPKTYPKPNTCSKPNPMNT